MRVHVKLLGNVRRYLGDHVEPLEVVLLGESAVVADAARTLGIPDDEPLVVGVSGHVGDLTTPIADGDTLTLVTPMAGGA
jgi:molybdopterin converting factor small subunit